VNVLGFPCNQFGGQEPGTDEEVLAFVRGRYRVTFPMFSKIEVNGPGAAPLYQWLKREQPGDGPSPDITWNFAKFLVDPEGRALARYAPQVTPEQTADELGRIRG
jgi:glutathione peroxidase